MRLTPAPCLTMSGNDLLRCGSLLTHAAGFVAQELLVIVQIPVEGLTPPLVTSQNSSHTARSRRGRG